MNPIALIILLCLAAVAFAIICIRHRREECHNAEDASEEKPKKPTVEEKAAAEVAAMKPQDAPKGITEQEIREKTAVGLTRDQAIEVIKNQRAHDAALAKEAKGKK